ncbi:hypothetical protein DPMN_068289 [Dreissena polymorpha]|uniref:Uncharacterized protein n=1 Tax=Dreissena polymorpha TaxID=45954 RepID=A0A9D4BTH3_DREPO|nr:hypothetical protein DPMN_068289 [Dreissena polymorpha]
MSTGSQFVSPEVPLTHDNFFFQGVDLSRRQRFLQHLRPPKEALLSLPVNLFIPTDVDVCWTPYFCDLYRFI